MATKQEEIGTSRRKLREVQTPRSMSIHKNNEGRGTQMKNAKGLILALTGALMLAAPTVRAQQANNMPDPSDNTKLYELAKQEGKIVFYHGAVDSAMRVVTGEFEKKYPGIAVTTIKDSGVA